MIIPPRVLHEASERFGLVHVQAAMGRGGAPDGAVHPTRVGRRHAFLKICPTTCDDVPVRRARVAVTTHLQRAGIRVPIHVATRGGDHVVVIDHQGEVFAATLTLRAPGRHVSIAREVNPELIRTWGTTTARMHRALLDVDRALPLHDWRSEYDGFARGCRDEELGRVWADIGRRIEQVPVEPDSHGVIHNDLHPGNLLVDRSGRLTVLDLDVCSRQWHLTEVATALVHPVWDMRGGHAEAVEPFVRGFLEAYRAEHRLQDGWREHLPVFMRYRMALLVLAMQDAGEGDGSWVRSLRSWVVSDSPLMELPAEL